jgi:hypothetical protein
VRACVRARLHRSLRDTPKKEGPVVESACARVRCLNRTCCHAYTATGSSNTYYASSIGYAVCCFARCAMSARV